MERVYQDLLRNHTSIINTSRMITACRIELPNDVRERILEETMRNQAASKTLQDRKEPATPIFSLPKHDMKLVMSKAEKLDDLFDQLQRREERLISYQALPLDLETVMLENDQMQRRLQILNQQRSDLFRSVR